MLANVNVQGKDKVVFSITDDPQGRTAGIFAVTNDLIDIIHELRLREFMT